MSGRGEALCPPVDPIATAQALAVRVNLQAGNKAAEGRLYVGK